MAASLRLLLSPVNAGESAFDPVEVVGFYLAFANRGAGDSKAQTGAALPAKIEFIGRFSATVRDKPAPDERPLGELSGEIMLADDPLAATFTCDEESLETLVKAPEPEDEPDDFIDFSPRHLELRFGEAFDGLEPLTPSAPEEEPSEPSADERAPEELDVVQPMRVPRLHLPLDSGRYRYLEVVAKLTIDGSPEADFEQNDVLDVLLAPPAPQTYPFSL